MILFLKKNTENLDFIKNQKKLFVVPINQSYIKYS